MTHRDELLALKARVEAQARELDEAKSEIELLRAAHANKTLQLEGLRREVAEEEATADGIGFENDGPPSVPSPARQIARSFHLGAMVMIGVAMATGLMVSAAASRRAHFRHVHGGRALALGAHHARPAVAPLVRTGTVVETSGPHLLDVGETCTVSRLPVRAGSFDCRVVVGCGGQILYGAQPMTGFVHCGGQEVIEDRQMTAADGDPAMRLDLARETVLVQERVGLGTQRIRIQL